MLNIPLDAKQVVSGTLFPANLLASTKKRSEQPEEAKYNT